LSGGEGIWRRPTACGEGRKYIGGKGEEKKMIAGPPLKGDNRKNESRVTRFRRTKGGFKHKKANSRKEYEEKTARPIRS